MQINKDTIMAIQSIALEAGNVIMAHRTTNPAQRMKDDGSPVTEADLKADALIREELNRLNSDIPAITEETYNHENETEPPMYWCVDPLDGTKGFINGSKDFTVNIALIKNRAPILGVIYAPAQGELWSGHDGMAFKHSTSPSENMQLADMGKAEPIQARLVNTENPDIVATKAHRSPPLEEWIGKLNHRSHLAIGSSLKFCVIAEGKADLYPRIGKTMEWDTAAGQAILEAAGGVVLDAGGKPFSYGKPQRVNGYFVAIGKIEGEIPSAWLPPSGEKNHG